MDIPELTFNETGLYQGLSALYAARGLHNQAIKYNLEGLKIAEEWNHKTAIAGFLGTLGTIYGRIGDYERALDLAKEALSKHDTNHFNYKQMVVWNYNHMSIYYKHLNKHDSAIFYAQKTIEIGKELKQDQFIYAGTGNLIDAYNTSGQYEKTLDIVDTLTLTKERILTNPLANILLEKGRAESSLGQLDRAKASLLEADKYLNEAKSYPEIVECMDLLADIYEQTGNPGTALSLFKASRILSDSLDNAKKVTITRELEAKYENAVKENEITLLKENLAKQRLRQSLLYGGGSVFLIISLIAYRFYRVKLRDNRLLEEKNREIEQKNKNLLELSIYKQGLTHMIAHDMKNPLNIVLGMTEGSANKEKMEEIRQSGQLMLQMVTNMLDIQKFEETKMNLTLASHPLQDLVVKAKYQVELLLMAKSIRFINNTDASILLEVDKDILVSGIGQPLYQRHQIHGHGR